MFNDGKINHKPKLIQKASNFNIF